MSTGAAKGEAALLEQGARELGVDLGEETARRLLAYLDLVYVWNRHAGITTIARPDAVRLHVLDSLAVASELGGSPVLDLGTGGGLPGMVLAIVLPERDFVLAESNRKRCSFLHEVVRQLGLRNVRVVEGDVDRLSEPAGYPTVVSRAFRPPLEFLRTARPLVAAGGKVLLLTAAVADEELRTLGAGAGLDLVAAKRFELPGGREPRAIASFHPVPKQS